MKGENVLITPIGENNLGVSVPSSQSYQQPTKIKGILTSRVRKKEEKDLQQNKQDLEKVKAEAKLTNERLDNFLKTQSLKDHSAEELAFAKLQKSLELKAKETKESAENKNEF